MDNNTRNNEQDDIFSSHLEQKLKHYKFPVDKPVWNEIQSKLPENSSASTKSSVFKFPWKIISVVAFVGGVGVFLYNSFDNETVVSGGGSSKQTNEIVMASEAEKTSANDDTEYSLVTKDEILDNKNLNSKNNISQYESVNKHRNEEIIATKDKNIPAENSKSNTITQTAESKKTTKQISETDTENYNDFIIQDSQINEISKTAKNKEAITQITENKEITKQITETNTNNHDSFIAENINIILENKSQNIQEKIPNDEYLLQKETISQIYNPIQKTDTIIQENNFFAENTETNNIEQNLENVEFVIATMEESEPIVIDDTVQNEENTININSKEQFSRWTTSLNASFSSFPKKNKGFPPMQIGLSVRYNIIKHLGIESGVIYSHLSTTYVIRSVDSESTTKTDLHYLGIPLNVVASIFNRPKWEFYVAAGAMAEKGIQQNTHYITEGREEKNPISGLQWSLKGSIGIAYQFYRRWGIFAEPKISYYFDNKQPKSTYTEKRTSFGVIGGFRYKF
jgi:hypothetical protein